MQAELTNKIKNTVPHLLKVNFMYPKYTQDHHNNTRQTATKDKGKVNEAWVEFMEAWFKTNRWFTIFTMGISNAIRSSREINVVKI